MEHVINLNHIYARLFEPTGPAKKASVVIANSLFSENKYSRSFLVNSARQLCKFGYQVLFFDYRGMGESVGNSSSMSFSSISEDIDSVISYMNTKYGHPAVLIGFRGGAIPILCYIKHPAVSLIVLWEPVKKGSELIRFRNLIQNPKQGCGKHKINPDINVGGWYINSKFCEELKNWQLGEKVHVADKHKLYSIYFVSTGKVSCESLSDSHDCIDYVMSDKFWLFGSKEKLITPAELTGNHIQTIFGL